MLVAAALFSAFWFGRMEWDPGMRAWRAFGDTSIVLLFGSLSLGPLAKLSRASARLLPWRRELGIWCAVMAIAHTILVMVWWVKWDFGRLLGYEFIPELGRTARMEPGFGLANLMGLVALVWVLVLASTSSNRAVKLLGSPAWKWLHHGAYVLFYLTVLHTVYFLFLHYTMSFHRDVPPPNWFRWPLVALGVCVLGLQYAAFTKTVAPPPSRDAQRLGRRRPQELHLPPGTGTLPYPVAGVGRGRIAIHEILRAQQAFKLGRARCA